MKNLLIFAFAFVALFALSSAADCEKDGHKFNIGETYSPNGVCVELKCTAKGAVTGLGCPEEAAPSHCKYVPEDTSKPYPACCPKYVC